MIAALTLALMKEAANCDKGRKSGRRAKNREMMAAKNTAAMQEKVASDNRKAAVRELLFKEADEEWLMKKKPTKAEVKSGPKKPKQESMWKYLFKHPGTKKKKVTTARAFGGDLSDLKS